MKSQLSISRQLLKLWSQGLDQDALELVLDNADESWLSLLAEYRCGERRSLLSRLPQKRHGKLLERHILRQLKIAERGIDLYSSGLPILPSLSSKVAYIASQSFPYHSSGYAIRTHAIVSALNKVGVDIEVFTRFGYPNSRRDYLNKRLASDTHQIEGIRYHFKPARKFFSWHYKIQKHHNQAAQVLYKQLARFKPRLIHAATNFSTGLVGGAVAKSLNVPFIYEMRGLWHLTKTAQVPNYLDSDHYRMIDKLEIQAAESADHVFTISDALREYVIKRGIDAGKVSVLPNAAPRMYRDTQSLPDCRKCQEIKKRSSKIVGYVGSLKSYEGLDLLIRAVAIINRRGGNIGVVIVGDGPEKKFLENLSMTEKVNDVVHFVGRVSPADVPKYYNLLDLVVIPRKASPVSEMIPPLKPFDAMAANKCVLVSSARALAECVENNTTGIVFEKDNLDDLVKALTNILGDDILRQTIADNGLSWSQEHRSWEINAKYIKKTYRELTSQQLR